MLEVTGKSLRARRSIPCCRGRDGPDQSAVSSVGPAVARLVRLVPTITGGVSCLPLEEVHRPKPWLNYPAAAAKAMRLLARANRECTDCRVASLSLSSPLSFFLFLFLSLSSCLSSCVFFYFFLFSRSLFPLYIAFFSSALSFFSLFLLHQYTVYVSLFL